MALLSPQKSNGQIILEAAHLMPWLGTDSSLDKRKIGLDHSLFHVWIRQIHLIHEIRNSRSPLLSVNERLSNDHPVFNTRINLILSKCIIYRPLAALKDEIKLNCSGDGSIITKSIFDESIWNKKVTNKLNWLQHHQPSFWKSFIIAMRPLHQISSVKQMMGIHWPLDPLNLIGGPRLLDLW